MQPVGTLFVVGIHSRSLSRQVCAGRPCARSCVAHRSGPLNPGVEGVPLAGINGLDRSSRTCQSNAGKLVGLVRFWKLTVTMRSEVGLGALKPHCSGRLPTPVVFNKVTRWLLLCLCKRQPWRTFPRAKSDLTSLRKLSCLPFQILGRRSNVQSLMPLDVDCLDCLDLLVQRVNARDNASERWPCGATCRVSCTLAMRIASILSIQPLYECELHIPSHVHAIIFPRTSHQVDEFVASSHARGGRATRPLAAPWGGRVPFIMSPYAKWAEIPRWSPR